MLKMLCTDLGISEFSSIPFTPYSFKNCFELVAPHGNILLSPLFRKGGVGCGWHVAKAAI